MMPRILCAAVPVLLLAASVSAGIVNVGTFQNLRDGNVQYDGAFGNYITSEQTGGSGQYTVIHLDISGLLASIGEEAFLSISVIDTGDNAYAGAPGADVDLFRINEVASYSFLYDGPTGVHQGETSAELGNRVNTLDWGTNGSGLSAGTFVSLGERGVLSAVFDDAQLLNGRAPVTMDLSEAGSAERFRVEIETVAVPAPGALGLLFLAGACAIGRRRR